MIWSFWTVLILTASLNAGAVVILECWTSLTPIESDSRAGRVLESLKSESVFANHETEIFRNRLERAFADIAEFHYRGPIDHQGSVMAFLEDLKGLEHTRLAGRLIDV